MNKPSLRQTWFPWLAFFVFAAFFVLAIVAMTPDHPVSDSGGPGDAYIRSIRFWDKHFTEPIETLYFKFYDETGFGVTSFNDMCVEGYEDGLVAHIQKQGKTVADVDVIIHNHLYSFTFSERDVRFVLYFRSLGFRGRFLLRQPTGRVIDYDKRR